ncbi:hypothetical protein N0V90_010473 [Kalmusia sp. IMI 367209]|nr:hypothetical protein N0V90_010473 [Kalmusia sp. IMI 367209]
MRGHIILLHWKFKQQKYTQEEFITCFADTRAQSQSPSDEDETDVEEWNPDDELKCIIRQKNVKKALEHLFDDDDDGRFNFGSRSDVDLTALHPTQVDIFRIWQIYLDNVNPLLKVTHTPTMQTRIIEAVADLSNAAPALQALMFGIYCVSMITLEDEECLTLFGKKCGELLRKFQLGCRQAMLRMGLHSESVNSEHTALEAEMRRRLWWALVLLDARVSEMSGFKCPILTPGWDCKPPSNINDFDLGTEMTTPPSRHENITEATFTVVRSEMADFVRYSGFWLDFTNPCLKPLACRLPDASSPNGDVLAALEKMVQERYLKFCNPENPLHFMIIWMARGYVAKNRQLAHYARHAQAPAKQTEVQRDMALGYALTLFECDTKLLTSPLTKRFVWFSMTILQFPFQAYIHVVQDLKRRPVGKYAARAWKVMSDNYTVRFTNWVGHENPLADIISKIVLQAWAARKVALPQSSETEPIPSIVEAMGQRRSRGMPPESQVPKLPSWLEQTMKNDDSWMPMPMPAPMPMSMDFGQFNQGYGSAWADPLSTVPDPMTADTAMDQVNWGNMDWASMPGGSGGGQGW